MQRSNNNKLKCWNCNKEGHLRKQCSAPQKERNKNYTKEQQGKLRSCHLKGQRLPYAQSAPFNVLLISSFQGGDHGLCVEGEINGFPCGMIIDTGANVTILRADVARRLDGHFLYTAPSLTLQTVNGDRISVNGKLNVKKLMGS